MHSKTGNIKFMIYDNAAEVIEDVFESLLKRYQIGLETSVRGRGFIFDCVHLLYYKCRKRNPNQDGLDNGSLDWIKNKKTTINPINNDDTYFQYATAVALNEKEKGTNSQRK